MPTPDAAATGWLATLLQGSGAALVGLIGAFLVFMLTRRHERRLADAEREAAERDRAAAAQLEVVSAVCTASALLARDIVTAPFFRTKGILELLVQIMRFVMVTRATHPAVSRWALAQHHLLTRAQLTYRRQWLRPWRRKARRSAWTQHAGELAGNLVLWQSGEISDEWFEEDLERLFALHPLLRDA